MFVPREQITIRDCTEHELADIHRSAEQFGRDKAAQTPATPFGLQVSPHYLRESREHSGVKPVIDPNKKRDCDDA